MVPPQTGPLSFDPPIRRAVVTTEPKVFPIARARGAGPNARLVVERLHDSAAMERLAVEWDALEAQIVPRLPFRGAWWNILWWRHFHEDRFLVSDELRVFVVREWEGTLIAVFPMMLTRRPGRGLALHRRIQFFGSDPNLTEVRGPICRPCDQARAVAAVATALDACRAEWDEVQWSGLRPDHDTSAVLGSLQGLRRTAPIEMFCLELPTDWEQFKRTRSRNIKESMRKCYNSLRRAGHDDCRLRVVDRIEEAREDDDALDVFLELHRMRASRRDMVRHADVFASPDSRAFLRAYAAHLARNGGLRLFGLEIGQQQVAARLGIQLGDELYLSFSGFRPEWAAYSVATTLVAEVLQWAIANGVRLVNLSVGRDVSKTRWSPTVSSFECAEQRGLNARSAWRRWLFEAAHQYSRDDRSWAGQWLASLRRNRFGRN